MISRDSERRREKDKKRSKEKLEKEKKKEKKTRSFEKKLCRHRGISQCFFLV